MPASQSATNPLPNLHTCGLLGLRVLFLFNAASATLWWCCLGRFLILLPLVGRRFLPGGIAEFFQVISLSHILGHFVRYLVGYGAESRQSRRYLWSLVYAVKACYICYVVIFPHPQIAKHVTYSVLILCWSLQLLTAYTFHALRSVNVKYAWLTWAYEYLPRLILPISSIAEMILIFLSLAYSADDSWIELINKSVLVAYVPVMYFAWPNVKNRSN